MAEYSGEKTQDPTPHRRQQARQQGQVVKSQDLASAVLLALGALGLMMMGGELTDFLLRYTQQQLAGQSPLSADSAYLVNQWTGLLWGLARYLLPLLGLLLLGAVVIEVSQVGFLFVPEKALPDLTRLDPLRGLGRMFSPNNAMRLVFGLFKIAVVATVAGVSLYNQRNEIFGLAGNGIGQIAAFLAQAMLWTGMKVAIALVVLAILDYGYQRWRYEQDLKMTPQEVREEMKNLEGDPQIIARRRVVQRQLVLNRVSTAVPKADVVITNPTELAVAIQYEPETMAAPIVVAKGAGLVAQRIRQLALEHGIPIVEKKPLAQALYREVDIGKPIPEDKYATVAEVLAYVYQLKGKKIPELPKAA